MKMAPPTGKRRAGVLAVLLVLVALFALAPAVEAYSFTYTTRYGTFPSLYRSWGYWLSQPASKPAPTPTPTPTPAPTPTPDPTPAPDPTPTPAPGTTSGYQPTADEVKAVQLLNADRAKNGLAALKLNADVTRVAHEKARDMAVNHYFDHTSPTYGSPFDMMRSFGISFRAAGENIAKASSVDQSEQLFMNSSGHRANILNSTYTQVGVGVYKGADGYTYVSQMFITP
jgi:uncharacterized YkwD family protein